jgi:hypothetical protein
MTPKEYVKERFPLAVLIYKDKWDFISKKFRTIYGVYRTADEGGDAFLAKGSRIGEGYTEQEAWRDAKNYIEVR